MLKVIVLNVVMLKVIVLSVIKLSVIMLNVLAPIRIRAETEADKKLGQSQSKFFTFLNKRINPAFPFFILNLQISNNRTERQVD
jgi:hypothetical protein